MMQSFNLDTTLMDLSGKGTTAAWTIRDAIEGVQIFGGIGSGKTSGSGKTLAQKFLLNGFGGLVLTVKPDEKEMWQEYCEQTNRLDDLIIVEPGEKNHFNFLEYESTQQKHGRSLTANIVQVLKTVIRASEEKAGGKSDDPFWETALDMLMANAIDLCLLAYNKVSVQLLYDIAQTVPRKDVTEPEDAAPKAFAEAIKAASENIRDQIDAWESSLSEEDRKSLQDNELFEQEICNAVPDARTLKFVDQFFMESFMNISEKTRAIIDFSFSGFLFNLLREPIYSTFCRFPSTFTPEDCMNGKIILLNLPVKFYHKVGRDCQILFKYIWQRAMEKRDTKTSPRPVFLWADEAQNFLHEYDAEYQATARSSRIATVYISQNLPNYYANMGGAKADYKVKSFMGTLGTKIFHANADIETNTYASTLIGEAYVEDNSRTSTVSGQFSASATKSYKLEKMVRPEEIVGLKTGGPFNNFMVDGYIHVQGKQLQDGFNFKKLRFSQISHI